MGLIPVGDMFKTLTFDGESSADYSVYITGQAVFNAPEKDVEMITVPGRNGTYALDSGRFENIEVTYPASIVADTEEEFAEAISDFRNFLCSRSGYCRLEDDYNPDEYRMAIYKSGLEVEATIRRAGEFELVFECKPQRWLKSGETPVSVTSGDVITNPTLFPSSPLLEVKGNGTIHFGSDVEINIVNREIGYVQIASPETVTGVAIYSQTIDASQFATGDTFDTNAMFSCFLNGVTYAYSTGYTDLNSFIVAAFAGASISAMTSIVTLTKGTSSTHTGTGTYSYTAGGTTSTATFTAIISYDGDDTITYSMSDTSGITMSNMQIQTGTISGYSTALTGGNPMYIDLDIGEAWNEDQGYPVSTNSSLSLPSKLPTFPTGAVEVTYDNTITSLVIHPRWWKV